MDDPSDAIVLARSLAAPEAFGELYDRHAATLLRYMARQVGRTTPRRCSESCSASRSSAATPSIWPAACPWLYGIATHLLLKHRRSEGRALRAWARLASTRERPADSEERSIARADARALFPKVIDALEALPDVERDVLLLFAWEDQSYEEIAAALEVPVGTVRSRLNRARQRLRELAKPAETDGTKRCRSARGGRAMKRELDLLLELRPRRRSTPRSSRARGRLMSRSAPARACRAAAGYAADHPHLPDDLDTALVWLRPPFGFRGGVRARDQPRRARGHADEFARPHHAWARRADTRRAKASVGCLAPVRA
jgi:RNA polymerase sigma-70 factor (ECF subfamily)